MAYTTIDDPSAYFKVQLYSGNGTAIASGGNVITFDDTDTDMQPDFVWYKERSSTSGHHLHDSVRGVTKKVSTDSTAADNTNTETLTSFNSDGFTVGSAGGSNQSGQTYVAWCWKAGTTSGITTNGDTDVTPSAYSFNQTSGVSIAKWSSAAGQVAHGLGKKPQFIMTKRLDAVGSWKTYHEVVDATDFIKMNDNAAREDNDTVWNDTEPDTVNFTVGSAFGSSDDYISYSFTSIQGFCKLGSYTGNGNADGPFIYTGFRPALVLVKKISATADWQNIDNKRGDGNGNEAHRLLWASTTDAESADYPQDLLSNGFKFYHGGEGNHRNESGQTYIYCAWAEQPFVNSNGVPCNAR